MTDRTRSIPRRVAALAAAGLLLATLTACMPDAAPEPTTPTPGTAAPTASPTPSGTPTSEPSPSADPADPSTWLIDLAGVGPVPLGATLAEVSPSLSALTPLEMPAGCTVAVFQGQGDDAALRLSIVQQGVDGPIVQAFVMSTGDPAAPPPSSPSTERDITLGAAEADLLAAYPDAVQLQDLGYAIYELENADGAYIYALVTRPNADGSGGTVVYGLVSSSVQGVAADFCV